MVRKGWKQACKTLAFLTILFVVSLNLWGIYGFNDNVHSKAVFKSFYGLNDNTVDAVWLGPSSVRFGFIPCEAYAHNGVAMYGLMTGSQPLCSARYLVEECQKTQHPKVYLLDIRSVIQQGKPLQTDLMRITSNMRTSPTRFAALADATGRMKEEIGSGAISKLATYVDFFHTRRDINCSDFGYDPYCFLGYSITTHCSPAKRDVAAKASLAPIPFEAEIEKTLTDFIDYCDGAGVELVFTCIPSDLKDEDYAKLIYAKQWLAEHNQKLLDFDPLVDEIGIDFQTDLSDQAHLNVYGARKLTTYVADYLKREYGLTDHRGEQGYEQYDKSHRLFTLRFECLDGGNVDVYEDYEPYSDMWREANFTKFD